MGASGNFQKNRGARREAVLADQTRVGALISGGGTNLQAIIDACSDHSIDAEMVFVGSDRPDAPGLKRAALNRIPTIIVDYSAIFEDFKRHPDRVELPADFDLEELQAKQSLFSSGADPRRVATYLKTRACAEAALLQQMQAYPFDLLVLAGFMRTLSPYLIDRVNTEPSLPRIMNIHPALLPSFAGVDGYGDTFRYGCKVGGCTIHFIDYGEDSGPIIGQRAFAIRPGDSLEDIRKRGLKQEWRLYPECIQMFAQGRLKVVNKRWELGKGRSVERRIVEIAPEDE
jgi:phosphoribosylglycinamide formyltransferase-1